MRLGPPYDEHPCKEPWAGHLTAAADKLEAKPGPVARLPVESVTDLSADPFAPVPPAIREALQIVSWDVWLIGPKISRALCGRDEAAHGERPEEDLVQNDWNGSAKVVLISIERSAAAWCAIADATADTEAQRLSHELQALQWEVDRVFPDARRFVRPGFDS